jgi:hypothetical protein
MSADTRRFWEEIEPHAKNLARILAPACERIALAGSARRGKPLVGDVEIVAIAKEFAEGNALHWLLDALVADGTITKARLGEKQATRWGEKYRALVYQDVKFDIFLTDTDSWGYIYWLRTGPADGNEWIAKRAKGAPFTLKDGAIWLGEQRIPVHEEDDWFHLLGIPYQPPQERSLARYETLFAKKGHQWGMPTHLVHKAQAGQVAWDGRYLHPSGRVWTQRMTTTFETFNDKPIKHTRIDYELLPLESSAAQYWANYLATKCFPSLREAYYRDFQRWLQQETILPDAVELEDAAFLLASDSPRLEVMVALDKITPTQATVGAAGVVEYQTTRNMRDRDGKLPLAIRFPEEDRIYLLDGHHRLVAARQRGDVVMQIVLMEYEDKEKFLADVLDEVVAILQEGQALHV